MAGRVPIDASSAALSWPGEGAARRKRAAARSGEVTWWNRMIPLKRAASPELTGAGTELREEPGAASLGVREPLP
jgi:hypothetical protein